MGVYGGQGDPDRSMALLWAAPASEGTRTAPGPRPRLSVEAIVAAAIEVADAGPLEGLSMRTVAERLGRSSMALYTYVPGKGELLDLMYDRVHAELSGRTGPGEDWRAAVTAWARELRAFYLRHPWVLQVSHARPVLGPHEQAVLERLAGILRGTGLPARTLRGVVGALFDFVRGAARTVAEARTAVAATGVSDEEWWARRAGVLAKVAPDFAERFPMSVWLGGEDTEPSGDGDAPYLERGAEETFTIGLDVLLDGIEEARKRLPPGEAV